MSSSSSDDDSSSVVSIRDIVDQAFHDIHRFVPRDWQVEVANHLMECALLPSPPTPQPILLVKATGGGKSAVRDAVGLAVGALH